MSGRKNPKTLLVMAVILLLGWRNPVGDIIYVDDDAPGGGDGTTWSSAYKYLQDALDDAGLLDHIWVAEGTYKPDEDEGGNVTPGDREATFQLINSVGVYGGFPSFGTWEQRDPSEYETILSGDLDGNDVEVNDPCDLLTEPTRGENSFHVVTGSGTDESAVLDGFTIMGGNANGESDLHFCGGGMFNWESSPTVSNCTFIANSADFDGGGMFNYAELEFAPTLINCTFSGNSAGGGGGGVFNTDLSSLTLTNCTFSGNWATYDGGGMCNIFSNQTVTNCIFTNNTSDIVGGGISNEFSNSVVTNCTFSGNLAAEKGGGIFNVDSDANLRNCILWGDTAPDGSEIALTNGSTVDVNYCDVKDGNDGIHKDGTSTINWGTGNIDADPLFVDAAGPLYDYPRDRYIQAGPGDSLHWFSFSFNDVPITAVSFDWGVRFNEFRAFADGVEFFSSPGGWDWWDWGNSGTVYFDSPVTTLKFGDSQLGEIEVDNLIVATIVFDFDDAPYLGVAAEIEAYMETIYGSDITVVGGLVGDDSNDFHLLPDSPCIDAGDNNSVPADSTDLDNDGNTVEPIPWDLDGRPRFADGDCNDSEIVDMGAYEFTYAYYGDFDGDCDVEFIDYSIFAGFWLTDEFLVDIAPTPAGDGIVDERDLNILCDNWLVGVE